MPAATDEGVPGLWLVPVEKDMSRDPTLTLTPLLLAIAAAGCGERELAPLEPAEPSAPVPAAVEAAALPSNTWVHLADLPIERASANLAAVPKADGNTRLFAIGGYHVRYDTNAAGTPVTRFSPVGEVTEWLPGTNRWVKRTNSPYVWQWAQPDAAVIGSRIYIPGGFYRCGSCVSPRNTMAIYDAASDTWTTVTLPQYATRGFAWAAGGRLYWAGRCNDSETGDGDGTYTVCRDSGSRPTFLLRYDPSSGSWTYLTPPATAADRWGGVTGVIGGRLYLAGGAITDLEAYDPAQDRWLARQPLDRARYNAGGDAVKGKFYLVGGLMLKPDGTWGTSRATSEYDPATNLWTARAQVPEPSNGATRVVVGGQARLAALGGPGHHWQWAP